MIRNYLKIAFRTLMKQKLFSFINIFGLALAMSVCMMVMINIKHQLSYDSFHPDPANTYRIITQLTNAKKQDFRFATTPLPFAENFTNEYDLTAATTRFYLPGPQNVIMPDKSLLSFSPAFVDNSFFSIFGFRFKEGSNKTSLDKPNTIVLSTDMKQRLFGADANVVGKTIEIKNWGNFLVSGVLDNSIGRSHLDQDAYISVSTVAQLEKNGKINNMLNVWDNFSNSYTYVLAKKGVSQTQLNRALSSVSKKLLQSSDKNSVADIKFEAQPIKKIIFGEELLGSTGQTGTKGKMLAEIAVALIILLSACFNYTNLSIARSLNRGKEVGIRKVAGALRFNVFLQFALESIIMAFLSFLLAVVFLRILIDVLPFLGEIIPEGFKFDVSVFGWFLLFTLFAGLLAGILPAWTLSSFKPVQVLKNLSTIKLFGTNGLRKTLIVFQFTLSLVIVLFTLVFAKQFDFMANADPLFNRDNILSVSLQGADPDLIKAELGMINGVEMISAVSENPGKYVSGSISVKSEPSAQPVGIDYYDVDNKYPSVIQLKFVAGASFPSDATIGRERYTIMNEAALKLLNLKSAQEAIGKQLLFNDSIPVQVVGVIKDFYSRGMEWIPTPLLLRNRAAEFSKILVKTAATNKETKAAIQSAWKKVYPFQEFQADWLKQSMESRYSAVGLSSMLGFLALITITIACLGLLGMVTYITQTRHKEIGIRKVMGAEVKSIMFILSRGFLKLIGVAALIGLPLGYVAGYLFLNIFSNRVTMGFDIFLLTLAGLFLIVMITIGGQIYKVAIANPVKALRSE